MPGIAFAGGAFPEQLQGEPLDLAPSSVEPTEEPVAPAPEVERKRARVKGGRFKADDPITPENEAFEPA